MGVPKSKISFIPTGIEEDFIKNKTIPFYLKTIEKLKEENKILLYLGSLSISSGHRVDILLKSFQKVLKRIPKCVLIISGSGPFELFIKFLN